MADADIATALGIGSGGYLETGNAIVDSRLRAQIDEITEARFRCEVQAWARKNTGRLRTRRGIRHEVSAEFRALVEALGPWAHVASREIFPSPGVPRWDGGCEPLDESCDPF